MQKESMGMEPKIETQVPNYKRLYAEFNREIISKMKSLGMEVEEEPYDLNEVLRYLADSPARMGKQLEDRNAIKAQIFSEWLANKGIALPENN